MKTTDPIKEKNYNMYSTTERLSSKARASFAGVTNGSGILTAVVILSGVLSSIFFWQNSRLVFADVYPPLAIVLGLAVGLIPAEGAFFGWKRIRSAKDDLTAKQLAATTIGVVASVGCSIFSTFSLFVASFQYVPAEISQYTNWFVFLALSLPVIIQVSIFAWYSINDRATIENYERGKLGAMGFNAYIRAEQARMQAVIDGMDLAMDSQLEAYGKLAGAGQADKLLTDGGQALLSMGKPNATEPQPVPTATDKPQELPPAYFAWLAATNGETASIVSVEDLSDVVPDETSNGKGSDTVNPTQRPQLLN